MYKFIAHRGNCDKLPENSKEAILNSLSKNYIDGVEFDIRITKDKEFVINHNAIIKNKFIRSMTLKELKKLNLKNKNKKYKIATLNEVLKEIKSNKIILIEIKEEYNLNYFERKKLIRILKKYNYLNIYLVSFNYDLILNIKDSFKNSGLLVGKVLNRNKNISVFPFLLIPLDFYKKYKGNQELFVWTINNKDDLKYINDSCYIITDKAKELYDFINQ